MNPNYDMVIVGAGIAGSSLCKCMAEVGVRVLLLESETQFRDRVRGEVLVPWGVAEAEMLGLRRALQQAGAHEIRWLSNHMGAQEIERRDFLATTPTNTPLMTFYHPNMQKALLQAAQDAGADVRRGAKMVVVHPGHPPRAKVQLGNHAEEVAARLIVLAEGRGSTLRKQAGFDVCREDQTLCIAGVLLRKVALLDDTFQMFTNCAAGEIAIWAPQGGQQGRAYLCHWAKNRARLQGARDFSSFLAAFAWTGLAPNYLSRAIQAGPLATFDGADTWAQHPYKDGIALLGDAAASNDPTWGQGLSLSLRGVRLLRDALQCTQDWESAGHSYAGKFDRCYGRLREVSGWFREFFLTTGSDADARRARAFALFAQDPGRIPDLLFSGPDIELAPNARARFFGEDQIAKAQA